MYEKYPCPIFFVLLKDENDPDPDSLSGYGSEDLRPSSTDDTEHQLCAILPMGWEGSGLLPIRDISPMAEIIPNTARALHTYHLIFFRQFVICLHPCSCHHLFFFFMKNTLDKWEKKKFELACWAIGWRGSWGRPTPPCPRGAAPWQDCWVWPLGTDSSPRRPRDLPEMKLYLFVW
jgi:hypothetical protein